MPDLNCRVAKLEQQNESIKEDIEEMKANILHILSLVTELKDDISTKRAFVAGGVAVCSVIWGVMWFLWDKLGGTIAVGSGLAVLIAFKMSKFFA